METVFYTLKGAHMSYRILRAAKNRFEPPMIGVFEMAEDGLSRG